MFYNFVLNQTLESTKILISVLHIIVSIGPYKLTHKNHPCVKWCCQSYGNFKWLLYHAYALALEYKHRYNKIHKCLGVIEKCKNFLFDDIGFTKPALAMPDVYKLNCPIASYRNYYIKNKLNSIQCNWTKREVPSWVLNNK